MWMIHEMTPISLWWSVQVICSLRWMYSLRPKHNLKTIINLSRNRQNKKTVLKIPSEGFFTWIFQSSSALGDEQITCQPSPVLSHQPSACRPSSHAWTCALRLLFYSCCRFHLQHPLSSRSTFPPLHVQTSPTLTLSPLMYSFIIVSFPVTFNKEPSVFSYLDHASHKILFGQTENRFWIWVFSDNVKIWWSMLVLW